MRTTVKEVGFVVFFLIVIALVAVEATESIRAETPRAGGTTADR